MKSFAHLLRTAVPAALPLLALVALDAAALTAQRAGGPGGRGGGGGEEGQESQEGPKEYSEIITEDAVSKDGLFGVHRVGDDLFFEIPRSELGVEMSLIGRAVESTIQEPSGFFGSGPVRQLIVQWDRDGDRILLRQKEYDVIADTTDAIWDVVSEYLRHKKTVNIKEAYLPKLKGVKDNPGIA